MITIETTNLSFAKITLQYLSVFVTRGFKIGAGFIGWLFIITTKGLKAVFNKNCCGYKILHICAKGITHYMAPFRYKPQPVSTMNTLHKKGKHLKTN